MAGLDTPMPRQQPSKQMSSRLLNMKFMQRAGASTPNSASSTPRTQPSYTNTPTSEATSKRRKIDDKTRSPHNSDPNSPVGTPFESLSRVGSNTFDRGPGAETEWVLNLGVKFPQSTLAHTSVRNNGQNGNAGSSIPGLTQDFASESGSASGSEEENLWQNQPAGRQTFGTFKQKRKSRVSVSSLKASEGQDEDGESESGSDSESGSMSENSDSDDSASGSKDGSRLNAHGSARNPRKGRNTGRGVDSDEEMQRVRREMKKKHDRMSGVNTPQSNRSSPRNQRGNSGAGGGGQSRAAQQQRQKHNNNQSSPDSTTKRKWAGSSGGGRSGDHRRTDRTPDKINAKSGKGRMSL